jgi:hypothetical protein
MVNGQWSMVNEIDKYVENIHHSPFTIDHCKGKEQKSFPSQQLTFFDKVCTR